MTFTPNSRDITSMSSNASFAQPESLRPLASESVRSGGVTVEAYGAEWVKRRTHLANARTEAAQLRLHVFPSIGNLELVNVRSRHIRDLVNVLRRKTSCAPKSCGQPLAPRTIRHVFAVLRLLFKSAIIDEHISSSPVMVERGVLPKNIDKDPTWRSSAIFSREELVSLISDVRIPFYRRVINALAGLAGLRHGEIAALRWNDYVQNCQPLGKLLVRRSGEKLGTKTGYAREIPVHPTLASILSEWAGQGWMTKYGREPSSDDLIVPTEGNAVRRSPNTLKAFKNDLAMLGLRARRSHDLRRTFITLAQVDGASRDVLRPMTHPGEQDIVGLYTSFPWPVRCRELAKLDVSYAIAGIANRTRTSRSRTKTGCLRKRHDHRPGHRVAGRNIPAPSVNTEDPSSRQPGLLFRKP